MKPGVFTLKEVRCPVWMGFEKLLFSNCTQFSWAFEKGISTRGNSRFHFQVWRTATRELGNARSSKPSHDATKQAKIAKFFDVSCQSILSRRNEHGT